VERVTSLGFEVRIELRLEDGNETWVQLDRGSAKQVDATVGERVYLSPEREPQAQRQAIMEEDMATPDT
jgi:hypothetical protein